jgi:hypothetical protein
MTTTEKKPNPTPKKPRAPRAPRNGHAVIGQAPPPPKAGLSLQEQVTYLTWYVAEQRGQIDRLANALGQLLAVQMQPQLQQQIQQQLIG